MDVVGADFANVLKEIQERLEGKPVAVTIPIGSASIKDSPTPFRGIIDLLEMQALYYDAEDKGKSFKSEAIPAELQAEAQNWRERIFDQLTSHDDQDRLTSAYLEGRPVSSEVIRQVLRQQTLRGQLQPVFYGSVREHIGIQPLLDAVTWYLPSPLDRPPVTGTNPRKPDKEEKRKPDPKEPFCGLVFKVVADPHGELFYLRIYSGMLKAQSRPLNPGKDRKEMVSKIYHIFADPKNREELPQAPPGDIVALVGLRDSITGDTLCDAQQPILLETIRFADTVISRSIEPESSADKQKLIDTLNSLKKEDPTFSWKVDPETGQTLMNGMGMLHLEIKQNRMERDFRLKVRVGQPLVSYRETLRALVTVSGEFRQPGAAGAYGKVTVNLEPFKGEQPVTVGSRIKPGRLTPELLTAAENGIRNALQSGDLGFPVINVRATIIDGVMDLQLSNEMAFEAAGADAVNQALKNNAELLEPIMHLEVMVPEEHLGAVTADLNARRAEITELHNRGKWHVIEALIPLAKTFDYSEKVRSLSQGRASWTMEPHSYRPAPPEVLRGFLGHE